MQRLMQMTSSNGRALGAVIACALIAACANRAGGHKSYILPAVEIVAMDAGVNRVGRLLLEPTPFDVTSASIRRNLRGPWVVDDDTVSDQPVRASLPGGDVSRDRPVERPELLAVGGLYVCRERALGNC